MNKSSVQAIRPGLWAIDDGRDDTAYLLEGSESALCIDTGCSVEPLLPVLRKLTDKPIRLALTHAHIDHIYRIGEFGTAYAGAGELRCWRRVHAPLLRAGFRMYRVPRTAIRCEQLTPLREDDVISLGDRTLRVIEVPGHTPGSVIYVDEVDRVIFTGDAFSSGEAAWMWLPGCSTVSAYRTQLLRALERLAPYEDFTLLGGHRGQSFPDERHPHRHPLTFDLIRDMVRLCEHMLTTHPKGRRVHIVPLPITRLYTYGTAAMVTLPGRIR